MPAISKIRLCNIVYENGSKRYNDQLFHFDGQNSAILLENGGGKTVFIQTVLQSIIPHINMADRKMKDTLHLEGGPAHIAIEWILQEQPRRYGLTSVSLYSENNQLNSLKYTYEYSATDENNIEEMPFKIKAGENFRPATRGEIAEYYQRMSKTNPYAKVYNSIIDYGKHLENVFKIIPSEWRKVAVINSGEGNVDEYFNRCKTTEQLLNNLLIPVVEEAIEGESATKFARTFEKQREHFKKNRILHEKIEQSKGVKEKIDTYIDVFKKYDELLVKSKTIKAKAKAVTLYIEESIKKTLHEKEALILRKEALETEQKVYDRQKLTFQILSIESKIKEKDKVLESLESKLSGQNSGKDEFSKRRQNIQLSIVEVSMKALEEDIHRLNIELSIEDKALPIEHLNEQLIENSSNIKGFYSYELELIRIEKDKHQQGIHQVSEEKNRLTEKLEDIKTQEIKIKEDIYKIEANIAIVKEVMDTIYDQLFEEQIGCDVEDFFAKLKKESSEIHLKMEQQKHFYQEKKKGVEEIEESIKSLNQQEFELKRKYHESTQEKQRIMETSHLLIGSLNLAGMKFKEDLIYTKEESIRSILQEKIAYYTEKKEQKLMTELQLMTLSMMKEVTHPSVVALYDRIKGQFDYLMLGQEYIQQLSKSLSIDRLQLLESYPFFAMTLVTNRSNKEAVITSLDIYSHELLVPLFVLTIEEIAQILRNQGEDVIFDSTIIPKLWKDSLIDGYLENHNEGIFADLETVHEERLDLETKLAKVNQLLSQVIEFFAFTPYDKYNSMIEVIKELEEELQRNSEEREGLSKNLEGILLWFKEFDDYQKINQDLFEQIQWKLLRCIEHDKAYTQYLNYRREEEELRGLISDCIYSRKDIELKIHDYVAFIGSEKDILKEYSFEERKILDFELYKEVETFAPICTNTDIKTLRNQRESLQNRIKGLSSSREALAINIKEQTKLLAHYKDQKKRLEKEAAFPIEKVDVFYQNEEDELFDKIVILKKEIKSMEGDIKNEEKIRWGLETERNLALNELTLLGGEVVEFDCELQHIPMRLKIFEGTLRDTKRKIIQEENDLNRIIESSTQDLTRLRVKDGSYNFMLEEEIKLPSRELKELIENKESILNQLFQLMSENQLALMKAFELVDLEKQGVHNYCRDSIDDYRLKEAITNGLMEKKEYKELLIYQERMTDIIHKTIQLANDDKRESDMELMTFLSHLLTYVKTIITELDHLQKKTQIDLEDISKQIFVFDIPHFDDELAKESLRLYVDQMIGFVEEEGAKDDESLRILIEERLSVKNLIPVVLNHLPIKIKCRKVTNDLKINKAPMSWEHSNKWSGGEKWSKNMTLFLGILNYLAEKRQHLSSNQRQNRTVILDNPFGKASSKHVLDPVFFIAQRLGFQIIALTAHGEGQFIRDYFPVVYSLRLRETGQENRLLMTSERSLNYTYLKEKAPASINRLQELEQLDLFS